MNKPNDYLNYKLRSAEKDVCVNRTYWKSEGIYLNDICLAVHFSRKTTENGHNLKKGYTAKDELYAMLRSIGQIALEHDLMRPVACVISNDCPDIEEIKRWGSDQDWHRGAFTLYVEKDVSVRLSDLLTLKIEPLSYESTDPIKRPDKICEDFRKDFNHRINMMSLEERKNAEELRGHLEAIIKDKAKNKTKPKELIQDWNKRWINR